MKYQVILRKKARKNLKRIDKRYRERILVALVELGKNPYLGKPLNGDLEGKFSLRVWPYRIIYEVFKKKLVVYIISVAYRQGAYKK